MPRYNLVPARVVMYAADGQQTRLLVFTPKAHMDALEAMVVMAGIADGDDLARHDLARPRCIRVEFSDRDPLLVVGGPGDLDWARRVMQTPAERRKQLSRLLGGSK